MNNDTAIPLTLEDGANIAVIGGGPTGSFFSIFALKMAKMLGKELNISIFESKDFTKTGPAGCNRCGGIISELLLQTLAVEGINLPDTVVRKGIDSYKLHTKYGMVSITTPTFDKTIATVFRGGGPKGFIGSDKESFDQFLLNHAVRGGAVHRSAMIDRIERQHGKPVLFSRKQQLLKADLVVGAFGVNSPTAHLFEELEFGYQRPPVITASIAEISMGEEAVLRYFGNSIHLFLLPDPGLKFAAMIPKGEHVTLCILGTSVNANTVNGFLEWPEVKGVLPKPADYRIECMCLPNMNIGAPKVPFADRLVMCGDAGSTRLFKDGLGAAYLMGKAAAKTAVFRGVSRYAFIKGYLPTYKSIMTDNIYGRVLYSIIGIYRKYGLLTRAMLKVVEKEQLNGRSEKILSGILWDMFTGNERYRRIFVRSTKVRMHLDLWEGIFKSLLRR